MNHPQAGLQEFLCWFSEIEEIPLNTRKDFLSHILKIGHLDEKSIQFIEQTLDKIERRFNKDLSELRQEIAERTEELNREKNPETSVLERIYRTAEAKFRELVKNFKQDFRADEAQKLKKEEFLEDSQNQAQIEALKSAIA